MQIGFGLPPQLEALQVHQPEGAASFLRTWDGEITTIRFEVVSLQRDTTCWGVDYLLNQSDGSRALIILGALLRPRTSILFPRHLEGCPPRLIQKLVHQTTAELDASNGQAALRWMSGPGALELSPQIIDGRAVPGLCEYLTATNHLKRYQFASQHLLCGSVLDCASGIGYGAEILMASDQVTSYIGVDADGNAISLARKISGSSNVTFVESLLEHANTDPARNVVSMETLEHVGDPDSFLRSLIDKLHPDGQLILSTPAERWAGSHLNPYHVTNWNAHRFHRLISDNFDDFHIFYQQLSFIGTNTFDRSDVYDRPANPDVDETFIAIARRPRERRKRSRIVLRRDHALGDTILATPLAKGLRESQPDSRLVVVTRHTQVFINNPHADLVSNPKFTPAKEDIVIDLNGAYESARDLHIIEAYSNHARIPLASVDPQLFPTPSEVRHVARALIERWQDQPIDHVVAIHAAATSPDRIWPLPHWQDFLSRILNRGTVGIVLVGAANDYGPDALDLIHEPNVISLVSRADLLTTAAAISLSDMFVGPDSGLSHVATAVKTQSIVLFGMADPATRVSLNGRSIAIWANVECRNCIREIPPDAPPLCKLERAICMEHILPSEVYLAYESACRAVQPHSWRQRARCTGLTVAHAAPSNVNTSSPEKTGWLRKFISASRVP